MSSSQFRLVLAATTLVLALGPVSAALAAPATSVTSLSVVSADVKIQSMQVTSTQSGKSLISLTQVVVQNDNDDDAQNVQVIVTLPPTSHMVIPLANATPGPSFADPSTSWRTIGFVTIGLGTIGVGQTKAVSLTTEMLAEEATPSTSIGAFVFSNLPDPSGASNFRAQPVMSQ